MSVSLAIKRLGPEMLESFAALNQLHIDAHLIVCFLDATFQEIGDAELVRNLGETLRCVLITLR